MNGSLKCLLKGLLSKNPQERFHWDQVSSSPWVQYVSWEDVVKRRYKPPWIPPVSKEPGSTE
jgi:hypothetical protein